MNNDIFKPFKNRKLSFEEIFIIEDWQVKIYTITSNAHFESLKTLEYVTSLLGSLLGSASDHHHLAFLIVHEGTDGVWSILNWWTGREMLRITTYYTSFEKLDSIELKPDTGSMACVWELPIINHERNAWVKHVLQNHTNPDFIGYANDSLKVPLI